MTCMTPTSTGWRWRSATRTAIEAVEFPGDNPDMTAINVSGIAYTSALAAILAADDIEPGTDVSYQLCKLLWTCHPLGGKLVEKPITIAQSGRRKINIPGSYEDDMVEAYWREWDSLRCDAHIRDTMHLSRAY